MTLAGDYVDDVVYNNRDGRQAHSEKKGAAGLQTEDYPRPENINPYFPSSCQPSHGGNPSPPVTIACLSFSSS